MRRRGHEERTRTKRYQIDHAVRTLLPLLQAHHALRYGSPYDGKIHGKPSATAIQSFLRRRGKPLPPSYRTFLKTRNGWSGYVGGFTLTGVSGQHTTRARRDIRETLEIFRDAWRAQYGEPSPEKIAAKEQVSRDEAAYVDDMIPFGTDFNGALLLFDPKSRRRDDEMEVLLWDSSGPSRRYRGFVEMLHADRRELKQQILEARGK